MPSVQRIGGESVVVPVLDVDIDLSDDTAEERVHTNWSELLAACDMAGRRDAASLVGGFDGNNGTVQLPAGTIYVSKPTDDARPILGLDERHAGITIRGAGREKTVLNDPYTHTSGGEVILALISRRISYFSGGSYTSGSTSVTVIDPADIQRRR